MRATSTAGLSVGIIVAALIVLVPVAGHGATVTCNDTGLTYETSCVGQSAGTRCINNTSSALRCCDKGTCTATGNCDLTNPGGVGQDACDDSNECTDDSCLALVLQRVCTFDNVAAGTACDLDEDVCTLDECDGNGTCEAGANEDCSAFPPPTNTCKEYQCDPTAGCQIENKPQGASCNDGRDCTRGDVCGSNAKCCGSGVQCGIAPVGAPCREDNTNDPSNRTWCKAGTCDGSNQGCKMVQTISQGQPCDPNPCTNATCQSNGGQCLVNSCNDSSVTCPNCGGSECLDYPTLPEDANFPLICGCTTVIE